MIFSRGRRFRAPTFFWWVKLILTSCLFWTGSADLLLFYFVERIYQTYAHPSITFLWKLVLQARE